MPSKVSCLYLLTVLCWASALWYLSGSRPSSSYSGQMAAIPVRRSSARGLAGAGKNLTYGNVRTRPLNPHVFPFLINEPDKCHTPPAEAAAGNSTPPFLIILISTTHKEFDARQVRMLIACLFCIFRGFTIYIFFIQYAKAQNVHFSDLCHFFF